LLAQALCVLFRDQVLCVDVDWEHCPPPFEVKYLHIELSRRLPIK